MTAKWASSVIAVTLCLMNGDEPALVDYSPGAGMQLVVGMNLEWKAPVFRRIDEVQAPAELQFSWLVIMRLLRHHVLGAYDRSGEPITAETYDAYLGAWPNPLADEFGLWGWPIRVSETGEPFRWGGMGVPRR
jgi:hypothetical protein